MPQQFKDHFSGHAEQYAAARPTYPPELFAWLATLGPAHELAWDAATGNGQAARGLAEHFDHVFATDGSAPQIAAAGAHPRIRFAVEPAEQCSLADHSVDLITVAQAAHWFDREPFYAEAKRVLKNDGALAMWCYGINTVSERIDPLFLEFYHSLDAYWPPERKFVESGYRTLAFPFAEVEGPVFELQCHWRYEQFLAYLRSWSATQRCLRATGSDPVETIAATLADIWGDRTRQVRWPINFRVGHNR